MNADRTAPPLDLGVASAHEPDGRFHRTAQLGLARFLALGPRGLVLAEGSDRIELDAEGRWHRAWLDGRSYQRGLSGRVRVVDPRRSRGRQRPRIELMDRAPEVQARIVARLRSVRQSAVAPLPDDVSESLEQATRWTLDAYEEERARYREIYRPVSILPPDQSLALVLQATLGCAWGRCRFCKLYAGQRHRVRAIEEFRVHTRSVQKLWGRALCSRRGVFLGQAAAFDIEPGHLSRLLDVVREEVGDAERWPVSAFGDFFSAQPSPTALRQLRAQGLVGVTLGLESGSESVLARLEKPIVVPAAIATALRLRDAGFRRGLTVLIGATSPQREAEHVEETARTLQAMELGESERVYLSPLDSRSNRGPSLEARVDRMRDALRDAGVRAKIALYDVGRFLH